jgi:phosphoribosylaminoimidazole-succinocarboxamide synthase
LFDNPSTPNRSLAAESQIMTMSSIHQILLRLGFRRIHQGKVRDTYEVPDRFQKSGCRVRLVIATDRVSVFDFPLDAEIPDKGEILVAMNIFWRNAIEGIPHDLVAYGVGIDEYLPIELRNNPVLQRRATIIRELLMLPIEGVVRGYLTGSALKAYNKTLPHVYCGHILPNGLSNWSKLETPLFTPTTKAEKGHDEPIDYREVRNRYGMEPERLSLELYGFGRIAAEKQGIIVVDTKFEFGMQGDLCFLADEVLTPDSSRYLERSDFEASSREGRQPKSYDKQFVRDFAASIGINGEKLDPTDDEDRAHVFAQRIPAEIVNATSATYHEIFGKITGQSLLEFQEGSMGIVQLSTR